MTVRILLLPAYYCDRSADPAAISLMPHSFVTVCLRDIRVTVYCFRDCKPTRFVLVRRRLLRIFGL